MEISIIIFYFLLMLVAFLYASVGHGGASGYLALMAFFSYTPETMRPTALLLNIFVSLIAFFQYYRSGYFRWKIFWPFAVTSIPAAYIGGHIAIHSEIYKPMLGILLLFPVIRLAGFRFTNSSTNKSPDKIAALLIGAVIGLLSGMIGIGGGIILSPVILLLHWANMKETAAVSALFIFVNSLAGIAGLFTNGFEFRQEMGIMAAIAFAGGLAGSYFGAKYFQNTFLSKLLAVVLLIASVKLIFT